MSGKLVRDGICEIVELNETHTFRVADRSERGALLIQKLREEAAELDMAESVTAWEEEVADLLEVVYALMAITDFDRVARIAQEKRKAKGSFTAFVVMTPIEREVPTG
jgi:predicted house-cleaning noncanonical NTP pyrophosphatase (MazG superfamily)